MALGRLTRDPFVQMFGQGNGNAWSLSVHHDVALIKGSNAKGSTPSIPKLGNGGIFNFRLAEKLKVVQCRAL